MSFAKADIISRLQRELLFLQGFKPNRNGEAVDIGIGLMNDAFPNGIFPVGAVHEFACGGQEDVAATAGFIAGLLGKLMQNGGICLWIGSSRILFPPALKSFGVEPDKIVFVDVQKSKDVLWVMEESLKCEGLVAVIGEMPEISFTNSRRLQLAVEQSRVTGFIIRCNARNLNTTACVTRWKITSVPSMLPGDMPGIGFPQWNVELWKVRNGKPGTWKIEWNAGRFRHVSMITPLLQELRKKTG